MKALTDSQVSQLWRIHDIIKIEYQELKEFRDDYGDEEEKLTRIADQLYGVILSLALLEEDNERLMLLEEDNEMLKYKENN